MSADERVQYAMDLNRLREVAQAATPGPWEWREGHARYLGAPGAKVLHASSYEDHEDVQSSEADARHVATFDPATVLALITELDRLREGVRALVERITAEVEADGDCSNHQNDCGPCWKGETAERFRSLLGNDEGGA